MSSDDFLSGGRLEVTLEGLTFFRSKSSAAARGLDRVSQVEWAEIRRAGISTPPLGKPILWVEIVGATAPADTADGPHSYKVKRRRIEEAHALVEAINAESDGRRRWSAPPKDL
ncbi:hypothetical protein [Nocardioides sp.]|uniref:hypothetical protein n=1 Tax=Nocardioides sp. TaxID=35761 RepID=UPI003D13839A